jgi:hypothetical protein
MWVEVSFKGKGWGEGVSKSGKVFLERNGIENSCNGTS